MMRSKMTQFPIDRILSCGMMCANMEQEGGVVMSDNQKEFHVIMPDELERMSRSKPKRPTFADQRGTAKRVGQFLKSIYDANRYSRKVAAELAGISEGFLTGLLAGRSAFPAQDVLREMAAKWGFTIMEYYVAAGLITQNDLADYLHKKEVLPASAPHEVQVLYSRLIALPAYQRKTRTAALIAMLNSMES